MKARSINNINYKSLLNYGFILKDNIYYYEKNILKDKFKVIIEIKDNLKSKVIDNISNEEYILVDIDSASGNYVGLVRDEYENIILDIINTCTSKELFKFKQTKKVLQYIKETYHDNPEYLWKKYPDCGAIRNKSNNKWYCLIMTLAESKLGLKTDNYIEIIDLRYQKGKCEDIIDNKSIFPGYHMNKQSWITIKLDGSLNNEIIYSLIDNSYNLSIK